MIVDLAPVAPSPVITLTQQDTNSPATLILTSAAEPISLELQAFMRGPQGAPGIAPVITITVHAISATATPTITAGGTVTGPTYDIGIPSGAAFNVDEFVAQADGEQDRTYANALPASTKVYINGLRQRGASFTINGSSITLPVTLQIRAGDLIQVEY